MLLVFIIHKFPFSRIHESHFIDIRNISTYTKTEEIQDLECLYEKKCDRKGKRTEEGPQRHRNGYREQKQEGGIQLNNLDISQSS